MRQRPPTNAKSPERARHIENHSTVERFVGDQLGHLPPEVQSLVIESSLELGRLLCDCPHPFIIQLHGSALGGGDFKKERGPDEMKPSDIDLEVVFVTGLSDDVSERRRERRAIEEYKAEIPRRYQDGFSRFKQDFATAPFEVNPLIYMKTLDVSALEDGELPNDSALVLLKKMCDVTMPVVVDDIMPKVRERVYAWSQSFGSDEAMKEKVLDILAGRLRDEGAHGWAIKQVYRAHLPEMIASERSRNAPRSSLSKALFGDGERCVKKMIDAERNLMYLTVRDNKAWMDELMVKQVEYCLSRGVKIASVLFPVARAYLSGDAIHDLRGKDRVEQLGAVVGDEEVLKRQLVDKLAHQPSQREDAPVQILQELFQHVFTTGASSIEGAGASLVEDSALCLRVLHHLVPPAIRAQILQKKWDADAESAARANPKRRAPKPRQVREKDLESPEAVSYIDAWLQKNTPMGETLRARVNEYRARIEDGKKPVEEMLDVLNILLSYADPVRLRRDGYAIPAGQKRTLFERALRELLDSAPDLGTFAEGRVTFTSPGAAISTALSLERLLLGSAEYQAIIASETPSRWLATIDPQTTEVGNHGVEKKEWRKTLEEKRRRMEEEIWRVQTSAGYTSGGQRIVRQMREMMEGHYTGNTTLADFMGECNKSTVGVFALASADAEYEVRRMYISRDGKGVHEHPARASGTRSTVNTGPVMIAKKGGLIGYVQNDGSGEGMPLSEQLTDAFIDDVREAFPGDPMLYLSLANVPYLEYAETRIGDVIIRSTTGPSGETKTVPAPMSRIDQSTELTLSKSAALRTVLARLLPKYDIIHGRIYFDPATGERLSEFDANIRQEAGGDIRIVTRVMRIPHVSGEIGVDAEPEETLEIGVPERLQIEADPTALSPGEIEIVSPAPGAGRDQSSRRAGAVDIEEV